MGVIAPPNSSGSTSSHESGLGSMPDVLDPFGCGGPLLHSGSSPSEPISSVTSLSNAVASTASIWGQPKAESQSPNSFFGFQRLASMPPPGAQPAPGQGPFFDPFSAKQMEMKLTSLQL